MLNTLKKTTFAAAVAAFTIVPALSETAVLKQNATPSDYLGAVDALHRFTWGMDSDNAELIASAFSEDGTADFSPAAKTLGIQFPPITGRGNIEKGLHGFASGLITSHSVANARVNVNGDEALMHAIVEAQHFPVKDRSRNMLMKNAYIVKLVRNGDGWLIQNMSIENIWSQGDVKVITGE
ncbi:MAG: nuclear transport factor 2 family protein [Rhizobiaceae bacterium]